MMTMMVMVVVVGRRVTVCGMGRRSGDHAAALIRVSAAGCGDRRRGPVVRL